MTDVATSLPQLDLEPGNTVTVSLDQAGAKITSMTVHVVQEPPPEAPPTAQFVPPLFVYGSNV